MVVGLFACCQAGQESALLLRTNPLQIPMTKNDFAFLWPQDQMNSRGAQSTKDGKTRARHLSLYLLATEKICVLS